MHDWITVARWEAMRLLRRKDFIISTLLIPVIVAAGIGISVFLRNRNESKVIRVAVVRADGAPVTMPEQKGIVWVTEPRSREALVDLVNEREVEGAVILPADLAAADTIDALVRWPRQDWVERVETLLEQEVRVARADAAGLAAGTLDALDRPVRLAERVTQPERGRSRADRVVAFGLMMLIVMSVFTAIAYMGIGISGEKQARVTEVIVSAITPQSWIDGKIAAYTGVGLLQAIVWALTIVVAMGFFLTTLPQAVNPAALGVSLLFAITGFAFFIALMAMVMATIKDLQSTTKFQAYFMFIPFLPFFFMEPALQSPDATWVVVLSLLPIFSPMLVPARFAIGGIAGWEVAVAFVLLLVGLYFVRRAAGAAFRIGMLMYGKEISLPELWRWAKTE